MTDTVFETLKRPPADRVAEQPIRGKILDGSLAPGTLLPPEHDLAEQLGVTRPTVREAMRSLESAGLIERGLGDLAGQFGVERREVDDHHVVVGSARDEPEAVRAERLGQGGRIGDDLSRVVAELLGRGFGEGDGLGGGFVGEGHVMLIPLGQRSFV